MARLILSVFLCLGAVFQVCAAGFNQSGSAMGPDATQEQARRMVLERIITTKLAYYAGKFPDIDFVLLDSGGNTERNLGALLTILGQDPIPLDYSHPESLRKMLLEVTYVRIAILLEHGIGSATLFAAGEGAGVTRTQVCVITMNPWKIAQDNLAATTHLLEIPGKITTEILPARYLDANSQLRFALDHEIYHCLDTSINGPVPMSKQEHWGGYFMWRDEAGADAFGILMHLAESGGVTPYVQNLSMIRGLTLLNGDPNHYTYPVFEDALQQDLTRLAASDVRERFQLATRIRNKVTGSYQDYLHYAAAAQSAMMRLGIGQDRENFDGTTADPATVEMLIRQVKSDYFNLVGRKWQKHD